MTFPDRQISQRSAETGASVALVSDAMEVRHALEELLDQLGPLQMAEEELGSVELVVAEALNNIVEHAGPYDPRPVGGAPSGKPLTASSAYGRGRGSSTRDVI